MTAYRDAVPLSLTRAADPTEPQTWMPTVLPDGRHGAIVHCANLCIGLLIAPPPFGAHSIDRSGTVMPSIGCRHCGWHVWATLLGWADLA